MKKSKATAMGGILVALTIISLFLARLIPTNKLTFLVIASVFVPVGIVSLNFYQGIIIYSASSLLAFLLGLNTFAILYAFLFGPYGILKFLVEKTRKIYLEIVLKLLFLNTITALFLILSKELLLYNLPKYITPVPLFLILQLLFIAYDYSLTLLIGYIQKRIHW